MPAATTNQILDLFLSFSMFLLCLYVTIVWSCEILAILRSKHEQDRFRENPLFSSFVLAFSPVVLLLHFCIQSLKKFRYFLRIVLISLVILLAILISPAFLLAIPLAILGNKLIHFAAPLGSRIYNLSLEFFD